jgi:hypothetical protein
MKKLFPLLAVAAFGIAISFASCTKKSATATCTCKYPSPYTTHDTTFSFSTSPTSGTTLSDYCSQANATYSLLGAGYGCHM